MNLYEASTVFDGTEDYEPTTLTLEEYEDAKKSLEIIVERSDMARRLNENKDFQELIIQGYLTDEPKRLAELMASGKLHEKNIANCVQDIDAIARFRNFLKMNIEQGNLARDELEALEEARDEAIQAEEEKLSKQ